MDSVKKRLKFWPILYSFNSCITAHTHTSKINIYLKEFNFQIRDDGTFCGFQGTKPGSSSIDSIGAYVKAIKSSIITRR